MELRIEQGKKNFLDKIKENPWILSTFALALIVAVFLGFLIANYSSQTKVVGNAVKLFEDVAAVDAELVSSTKIGDIYEITMDVSGRETIMETTKDFTFVRMKGSPYWTKVSDLQNSEPIEEIEEIETEQLSDELVKSDKPVVELFVMTHCPYGTQAEKAIIPAIKTLGNKIDATMRFVHYFMHGDEEQQESYRQLCIREETTKYLDYLSCFLEDSDSERCLNKLGLNVDSCIANKAENYYAQDSALSEGYAVRGSPTLIINGKQTSFTRSPAGALDAICSAFNEAPEECNVELSTSAASPGFGYAEGEDSEAQC